MQNKNLGLALWSVSVISLALVLIGLSHLFFGGFHMDTTADRRYSLDEKTISFLKKMQEPVTVRFYVSKNLAQQDAGLGQYADYVRRLLEEYGRVSKGKADISVVEVEPFASSQAAALKAGIEEFQTGNDKNYLYLGASFTSGSGKTLVIPKFLPARRQNVEDDISRILSVLVVGKKPVLGVISPFFRIAEADNPLVFSGNWPFIEQLKYFGFDIRPLSADFPLKPEEIDAVLVYYPVNLGKNEVYNLDQYLLHGGNIIVMPDAFSEERFRKRSDFVPYNSGMQEFLQSKGIAYSERVLAGDNVNNREIVLGGKKIKYPFWMSLPNGRQQILLNHSGFFEYEGQDGTVFTELLATGNDSGIMPDSALVNLDYDSLMEKYRVGKEKYPLVLLAEGRFVSLFDYPPSVNENALAFTKKSLKDGKILVAGDADMLNSALWNGNMNERQQPYEAVFSSDNLHFFRNAVDYMTNSGYIGIDRKNINIKGESLSSFFYDAALRSFAEQRKQNNLELANVRQELADAHKQAQQMGMPSIKQAKRLELLMRQELKLEEEGRKISYLITEKYTALTRWFILLSILASPVVSILIVAAGYYIYQRHIKRKIGEIANA